MKTCEVFKGVKIRKIYGELPEEISSVTDNSEKALNGGLFFVRKGNNYDGADYIRRASERGATVAVGETFKEGAKCFVEIDDIGESTVAILNNFYGSPQKKMKIVGVVGTNGKTSVCHILSEILSFCGIKTGVIGTIGVYYGGGKSELSLTTPGICELYEIFSKMRSAGVKAVAMEVSAHAIEQKRVKGIYFDALVFTNCTEDHLDYFKTIENYSAVKRSIFKPENAEYMIVNADDKLGQTIMNQNGIGVLSYGIYEPSDSFAIIRNEGLDGTEYIVNVLDYIAEVKSNLIGEYNVYNSLASLTVSAVLGVNLESAVTALERVKAVDGRAEKITEINGAFVYLDYAHTPDGLLKTLTSLKKLCRGKLVSLFGCGGNREKEKRKKMGEISAKYADFTVITDDNPRFENPEEIRKEIENGVKEVGGKYITVSDRRLAIKTALKILCEEDILLVAGKGAEKYQEINGERREFSDRNEILKAKSEIEGKN